MKKIFLIALIFIVSCSTTQYNSNFKESKKELKEISQDKNLTPEQKRIINHAITNMNIAEEQNKKVEKLTNQIINKSEDAGAGKMTKYIIGVIALGISAFLILKLKNMFI